MPKEMEYQIKMRRAFMKLFLRKIRTTRRLKTFLFNQKINNINPKIYFISYIKKKIRMQNKNDNFKNQLRKNIHYKSFFERFTNVDLNSQPFTKFVLLIIFNNFNLIRKEQIDCLNYLRSLKCVESLQYHGSIELERYDIL